MPVAQHRPTPLILLSEKNRSKEATFRRFPLQTLKLGKCIFTAQYQVGITNFHACSESTKVNRLSLTLENRNANALGWSIRQSFWPGPDSIHRTVSSTLTSDELGWPLFGTLTKANRSKKSNRQNWFEFGEKWESNSRLQVPFLENVSYFSDHSELKDSLSPDENSHRHCSLRTMSEETKEGLPTKNHLAKWSLSDSGRRPTVTGRLIAKQFCKVECPKECSAEFALIGLFDHLCRCFSKTSSRAASCLKSFSEIGWFVVMVKVVLWASRLVSEPRRVSRPEA